MFNINDRVKFINDSSSYIERGSVGTVTRIAKDSCRVRFDSALKRDVLTDDVYCGNFELEKLIVDDYQILNTFWETIHAQRNEIIDNHGFSDLRYTILSHTLDEIELALSAIRRNR